MKYGFKAGLLFTLSLSLAPLAANAYPGSAQVPQRGRAVAPILKTGCYYGGCWHPGIGTIGGRATPIFTGARITIGTPAMAMATAVAGTIMDIAGIIAIIAGARTTASAILVNARAHAMGADGTID